MITHKTVNTIRRALPRGAKTALAKLLVNNASGRLITELFRHRIPHYGFRVHVDSDRVALRQRAAIFWRLYERLEMSFLRQHMIGGLDIVELGGSIGVTACQTLRYLAPGRRYVIVEADPELAALLESNLKLNNAPEEVIVVSKALGYCDQGDGSVLFSRSRNNKAGGSFANHEKDELPSHDGLGKVEYFSVETTTLSSLIQENHIRDYVLISDIDIASMGIFLEDTQSLSGCKLMLLELEEGDYEGKHYDYDEINRVISSLGFSLIEKQDSCYAYARE